MIKTFLFCAAIALLPLSSAQVRASDYPVVKVEFNTKKITAVSAKGLADPATGRTITIDDPVRIASVSKLYVALGVMRLVDQRVLDLDRDVSDYLKWTLRNPKFPDQPITLRHLLSHQSSVTDDAEYLIPVNETIRAKMADPKAWNATHAPGSGWFQYTNLNFPIVATIMESVTGERFDRLITRLVMKPLKLTACFNWSPCSVVQAKKAVVLFRSTGELARDDLKGVLPSCPGVPAKEGGCDLSHYKPGDNGAIFSPQGGLRISARDLVKTGQMLMRGGKGFLKPSSFAALITPAWRFNGRNGVGENDLPSQGFFCRYGLAVQTLATKDAGCRDDPFGDGVSRIGHAGEAYGLKSGLWVDPVSKKGVAFFITAVPQDEPRGQSAFYAAEEALLRTPLSAPRK